MVKKLFLVVSTFLLFGSTPFARTITLEFEFPAPELKKKGEYFTVRMDGLSNFGNPGEPILPIKTIKALIPFNEIVERIEIFPQQKTFIEGEYVIMPGQRPVPLSKPRWIPIVPNSKIYNSPSVFPYRTHRSLKIQKFRGYRILPVNLYPVQLIPAEKTLFYYRKIRVRIRTREALGILAPERRLYRPLRKDKLLLMGKVDNPETIQTYREAPSGVLTLDGEGPYDYIIITSENLSDDFQPLINHKIQRGLSARIVTTEWIYSNYTGNDYPEKIRNFIIDAYSNWGIDYVLLGGDTEVVPYRGVYGYCEGYEDFNIPSDMYYGCLDGDWDADGDGIYGEVEDDVDMIAEVYVGRTPVESEQEVANFINKVIEYENSFSVAYHKKFLLVGEKLWDNPETWGGDYKDVIGLTIPPLYEVTRYYDRDGTFNSNGQLIIDAINDGVHFINHMGHSDYWMVAWIGDWEFYDISGDPNDIRNSENFCFFYSQGCYAGAFDQGGFPGGTTESVGENFVRSQYGAFAVIMNSRYGWFQPGDIENSPSQQFDEEFWDAVFNEELTNLGRANQDSKEDNLGLVNDDTTGAYRWCYYELNLLGDPETTFGFSASREGKIFFDKGEYKDVDEVKLTVMDMDLNSDHENIDTVSIPLTTSGGDSENIILEETDNNTGIFKGVMTLQQGIAQIGSGLLECEDGDTITATYVDEDDGLGNEVTRTANASADFTSPVIGNVQVINVEEDRATITWETDEPSISKVYYGTSLPLSLEVEDNTLVTSHSLNIINLSEGTTYYFAVESTDEAGNVSLDDNGGNYYSFTTKISVIIFSDDVESGQGNWEVSYQASQPPTYNWYITEHFACSGTHSWHFCKEEWDEEFGWIFTYNTGVEPCDGYLTSTEIDLRTASNAKLKFYHLLSIGGPENTWDWAKVEISTDGSTWEEIWQAVETAGFWQEKRIDLNSYVGSIIRIRFHFHCDWLAVAADIYPGWFVDDIRVISLEEAGEIISVTVNPTIWEIGNELRLGEAKATTEDYFTATNNGNVVEDFTIVSGDSLNWNCGATAGDETFAMEAKGGNFSEWTAIDGSQTLKNNIAVGGSVAFGLQFTAPTATAHLDTEQTIIVTITASKSIP